MNETKEHFKSGFVAIIGRPNVGKSTLLNVYLGQKIAAVSPRPQTTRRRQLGILTTDTAQIIFVDTPGLHKPKHKLGEYMNEAAKAALEDADVIVWIVDGSQHPQEEDLLISGILDTVKKKTLILAMNKIDISTKEQFAFHKDAYLALQPKAIPHTISAAGGYGLGDLLACIVDHLRGTAPLYDPEQITDLYEREIAADLIRESALIHLRDEVPHSIAVRIDEYKERSETQIYISATILVERESHKGITIGKNGEMIKQIGTSARQEIELMSGKRTFLDLRVKVNKNWRNNPDMLRRLGYFN